MAIALRSQPALARVLDRFPEYGALIRRHFLMDTSFRGACEDYDLARQELAAQQRADAAYSEDYRRLIEELEQEIIAMLRCKRGPAS